MRPAAPGRVLQRSLLGWGLGDLELGRHGAAVAWLGAEAVGIGLLAALALTLADSTWYLLPYLAGVAFIGVWGWQAIAAYHRARRSAGAARPADARSPAAAVVWLALPLLAWGTGFWLVGTEAASPERALDALVADWARLGGESAGDETPAPNAAVARLAALCAAGELSRDCSDDPADLFRAVRLRIVTADDDRAIALAEAIDLERRPSRLLGLIPATEVVPVTSEALLRIRLTARPVVLPFGLATPARAWQVVGVEPG